MNLPEFQLDVLPQELTRTEEDIVRKALTDKTVRKYLQQVLWAQIIDHANVPIPVLSENLTVAVVKQAFVKGGMSVIHMLLSLDKSQDPPTS